MKADINYKNLVINPENYRFDPVDTQEQAIDLMLEKKGAEILFLAKHILENGLDQAKDFRVLKKSENLYLVLDGNRRTTALKCLHDTSSIKDKSLREKFENLKIVKENLPSDIKSFIYNSEEEAAKWIKLDHTGKNQGAGQDSWGAPEVDRFGYKFEGKISPAMQALNKIESEMGIKFDTKKLKISTINRIFSNPESRSYLGIYIKNKKLIFNTDKKESINRLNKLFTKIINDDVNVSSVYTTEKAIEFMKELFGDKLPNLQVPLFKKEPTKEVDNGRDGEPLSLETEPKKRKTIKKKPHLERKNIPPSINELINECYDLDEYDFANAKTVLVRVSFECTLKYILDHTKHAKKKLIEYDFFEDVFFYTDKDGNKKKSKYVDFTRLTAKFIELISKTSAANSFRNFKLQPLHQVIHNYEVKAQSKQAKDLCDNLMPLLEFMLKEEKDLLSSLFLEKLK